jgi:hypothetical protein
VPQPVPQPTPDPPTARVSSRCGRGVFANCFSARLESSTRTPRVYPYKGNSQASSQAEPRLADVLALTRGRPSAADRQLQRLSTARRYSKCLSPSWKSATAEASDPAEHPVPSFRAQEQTAAPQVRMRPGGVDACDAEVLANRRARHMRLREGRRWRAPRSTVHTSSCPEKRPPPREQVRRAERQLALLIDEGERPSHPTRIRPFVAERQHDE